MDPKPDDALIGMIRCYVNMPRTSWPYLAMLFGAMALLVAGLFLPA